jgi:hypothetical protein
MLFVWAGFYRKITKKEEQSHNHVFNQLEPYLPMRGIKIRAYDIDTYDDYQRVVELIENW